MAFSTAWDEWKHIVLGQPRRAAGRAPVLGGTLIAAPQQELVLGLKLFLPGSCLSSFFLKRKGTFYGCRQKRAFACMLVIHAHSFIHTLP